MVGVRAAPGLVKRPAALPGSQLADSSPLSGRLAA